MARLFLMLAIFGLVQVAHLIASAWLLLAAIFQRERAWNIALGYDHLFNAVTGGHAQETLSSRAYRAALEGRKWGCILCKLLDRIERDHCKNSNDTDWH